MTSNLHSSVVNARALEFTPMPRPRTQASYRGLALLLVLLLFSPGDASLQQPTVRVDWQNETVWIGSTGAQQVFAGMVNPSGLEFDFRVPWVTAPQQRIRRIEVVLGDDFYFWTPQQTEQLDVVESQGRWSIEGLRFRGTEGSIRIVSSLTAARGRNGDRQPSAFISIAPPTVEANGVVVEVEAQLELREYSSSSTDPRDLNRWAQLRGLSSFHESARNGGQVVVGQIVRKDAALILSSSTPGENEWPAVERIRPWIREFLELR